MGIFVKKEQKQKTKYKITIQGGTKKYIKTVEDLEHGVVEITQYVKFKMVDLPAYISIEKL